MSPTAKLRDVSLGHVSFFSEREWVSKIHGGVWTGAHTPHHASDESKESGAKLKIEKGKDGQAPKEGRGTPAEGAAGGLT